MTVTQPLSGANALLDEALSAVEQQLTALGQALVQRDTTGIDQHATELQRALARAVDRFMRAARDGAVMPSHRRRLARASAQVAAQRESLARATAALDRAIEALMPRDAAAVYCANGGADRSSRGGMVQA